MKQYATDPGDLSGRGFSLVGIREWSALLRFVTVQLDGNPKLAVDFDRRDDCVDHGCLCW
jgi:hypothetical protein